MNVTDSTYSNRALQATQGVKKANQQANVKPVVARAEENNESNNVPNDAAKNKSRLDVSENAIALLQEQEQSNPSLFAGTQPSNQSNNQLSGQQSNQSGGQQSSQSQYDQPSKQNLSAVAAYESVDNIAQRENVKQFFGVNILV